MFANKSLILFIGVGFIVTVIIWGLIGGCGTTKYSNKPIKDTADEPSSISDIVDSANEETFDEDGVVYKVESGDTLWEISHNFNVSVADIKRANSLDSDTISVGQNLIIPVKEDKVYKHEEEKIKVVNEVVSEPSKKPKGNLAVYKVKKGDSLWRVAQKHGTNVKRITELNGLSKNVRLKSGQELLVPAVSD